VRLQDPDDCILATELTRRRGLASVKCRGEVDLYSASVIQMALGAAQQLATPLLEDERCDSPPARLFPGSSAHALRRA
jgi:hypothetical protein